MENVKTVHVVIELLAHPLVVSIVTIALGSYFLDRINRKREKREKKVDGAVKLAEDISSIINTDLSYLFLQIRRQQFDLLPDFVNASADAFKARLKFKIRIKTYFDNETFYLDYNSIIREISMIKQSIEKYPNNPSVEKENIVNRIETLKEQCHIKEYKIEPLKEPFNLYFSWAQILWYITENYSSKIYAQSLNVK